jgi:hypothetical protein
MACPCRLFSQKHKPVLIVHHKGHLEHKDQEKNFVFFVFFAGELQRGDGGCSGCRLFAWPTCSQLLSAGLSMCGRNVSEEVGRDYRVTP